MRKRCEGYRNQSSALPSRASCSRCFMALNPIVPIRKRKDKNLALSATFLRLGAAAISLNTDIGSKVQQINCWEAFFPSFAGGRGLPIEKKLQKGRDFCFQNERIATTGRMSQPAALKQEACRSRQCRGEGGAAAGSAATRGCLSGVISVAGRAAAGRCRGAQWVVSGGF